MAEDLTPNGRRRRGRPHQSWKNHVTDFMGSRTMEDVIAEDRHFWGLGMDRRFLLVEVIIIIIIIFHCTAARVRI